MTPPTNSQSEVTSETVDDPDVTMRYVNWRGVETVRRIRLFALSFGSTEWHPEPQWLLSAVDRDSGMVRQFALKDCDFLGTPSPQPTGEKR